MTIVDGEGNQVVYDFSAQAHFKDLDSVEGAFKDLALKFKKVKK